jgi:hypothetical protein
MLKQLDVLLCQILSDVSLTSVKCQSATACLLWVFHESVLCNKQIQGCVVNMIVENIHDATRKQLNRFS